MKWIVYIVTSVIVAVLGSAIMALKTYGDGGFYAGAFSLFPLALVLGWIVGDDDDRQDYRDVFNWVASKIGWK